MSQAKRYTLEMLQKAQEVIRDIPARPKTYSRTEAADYLLSDVRKAMTRGISLKDIAAAVLQETQVVVSVSRLEALLREDAKLKSKNTRKVATKRSEQAVKVVEDTNIHGQPLAKDDAQASHQISRNEGAFNDKSIRDFELPADRHEGIIGQKEIHEAGANASNTKTEESSNSGESDLSSLQAKGEDIRHVFPQFPKELQGNKLPALTEEQAKEYGLYNDDYHYISNDPGTVIMAYLNYKMLDEKNRLRCYFRNILTGELFFLYAHDYKNDGRYTPYDSSVNFYEVGNENGIYRLKLRKTKNGTGWESAQCVTPSNSRSNILESIKRIVLENRK